MKNLNTYIITFIFIFICNSISFSQKISSETIKYLVTWDVEEESDKKIICTVTESDSANYRIKKISFYRGSVQDENILAMFNEDDFIVAIFPLKDVSSNLMTIWEGGSAYKIRVYSYFNGKIQKTLEETSRLYPELFFDNRDFGTPSIVITDTQLKKTRSAGKFEQQPTMSVIYKWNGTKFLKSKKVVWEKRFTLGK